MASAIDRNSLFRFLAKIPSDGVDHPHDTPIKDRMAFKGTSSGVPFVGPLKTAPLVLLYLTPGGLDGPQDLSIERQAIRSANRRGTNIMQIAHYSPSHLKWLRSRLKPFGELEEFYDKFAILNLDMHHAQNFTTSELLSNFPSSRVIKQWAQEVLFSEAEQGKRVVVCMRARTLWGLSGNWRHGKSLFAPETNRSGHMRSDGINEKRRSIIVHSARKAMGLS